MAADCSFFHSSTVSTMDSLPYCIADGAANRSFSLSSTVFTTVCRPYCSADGSRLLVLPLVIGFYNGLPAVLLCGWQRIAHCSARQRLFRRFARCMAPRMAADFSFFRLSTVFTTVCAPYCSADGSGLLILALLNGFHDGLRAVLLSGWRRIAHSSTRQRLSRRFACRISQRMAADCSFFLSSTAFTFTTDCVPYCSTDCSALLILALVNGFHEGLHAILLSGWQRIAHSSPAFPTVCTPYCSADGSALLILPLFKGCHDGLRAILLSGWQRIAHTSAHQQLSQRFARRIAQRMAVDCSFFRSSTGFITICARYHSANGSADGITAR